MISLLDYGIKQIIEFNTNNAWGFGGGIGKETLYISGAKVRNGTASYRHLPDQKFYVIYDKNGKVVYDAPTSPAPGSDVYYKMKKVTETGLL